LASPNVNQNQSAYRLGQSTETALLLLLDRKYLAAVGTRSTLLVSGSLDLAQLMTQLMMMYYFAGSITASVLLALLTWGLRLEIGCVTSQSFTCQLK